MANTSCMAMTILLVSLFLQILMVKGQGPLAPALYVFGDSLSDSGNNNYLKTEAKVNYKPYGIDSPYGATGRFSNGKTVVDFLAEGLGLPFVPPYMDLSTSKKSAVTTGINYASGAAGILPETGSATGNIMSLDDQIKYFGKNLLTDLVWKFPNPLAFLDYMSNSIFFVSIGSNDYINNYLQPANYDSSKKYTPEQYANRLLHGLKRRLTRLYLLGARKFVVFNIGRIGCAPAIVSGANATTPCAEDINNLVLLYNTKFPSMIKSLENTLFGSTFIRGDAYSMTKNSSEAGISAAQVPCCKVSSTTGLCLEDSTPCTDRTAYIFWDAFHPTEVANAVAANDCLSGSSCAPINIKQLVEKKDVYSF